jgi:hypothetical protein
LKKTQTDLLLSSKFSDFSLIPLALPPQTPRHKDGASYHRQGIAF